MNIWEETTFTGDQDKWSGWTMRPKKQAFSFSDHVPALALAATAVLLAVVFI